MIQKEIYQKNNTFTAYTIKANDSLTHICHRFNSNKYRIQQLNPQIDLENLKVGVVLLVEEKTADKLIDQDEDLSPDDKFLKPSPNTSPSKKILFQQIQPKPFSLKGDDDDFDEFQKMKQVTTDFSDYKITEEAYFVTTTGNVSGKFILTQEKILFVPEFDKLTQLILDNTRRRLKEIDQEFLESYKAEIRMEDVYVVRALKKINEWYLQIYAYGVLGVELPLRDASDNVALIKVEFIFKEELVDPTIRKYAELNKTQTHPQRLAELMSDILCTELYSGSINVFKHAVNIGVLNSKLKISNDETHVAMTCLSQVSFYDLIAFNDIETKGDRRIIFERCKNKSNLQLNTKTKILEFDQFEALVKELPETLTHSDWFLMYSPSRHGTSYNELLRRCNLIGPHFLIIRDKQDNIFGAFLTNSWVKRGNRYYGNGDSFVFKFYSKTLKVYRWTKKNKGFQMASEEGLHIGMDDRPAITIREDLIRGYSYPCETYQNPLLTNEDTFEILDLEIWGFSESCQAILRTMRQCQAYFSNDF